MRIILSKREVRHKCQFPVLSGHATFNFSASLYNNFTVFIHNVLFTSGKEPHMIEKLPAGKYTLREETAPFGYVIAQDIEFEVKETATTV